MIYDTLTPRQKDVLALVIQGYSNLEIAHKLFLCYSRVSIIVSDLYNKYECDQGERRVKLVLKRLEELGILTPQIVLD